MGAQFGFGLWGDVSVDARLVGAPTAQHAEEPPHVDSCAIDDPSRAHQNGGFGIRAESVGISQSGFYEEKWREKEKQMGHFSAFVFYATIRRARMKLAGPQVAQGVLAIPLSQFGVPSLRAPALAQSGACEEPQGEPDGSLQRIQSPQQAHEGENIEMAAGTTQRCQPGAGMHRLTSASGAAWRALDAEVVGDVRAESLLRFTALVRSSSTGTDITVMPQAIPKVQHRRRWRPQPGHPPKGRRRFVCTNWLVWFLRASVVGHAELLVCDG